MTTTTLTPQQLATIYFDAWQSGDADRLCSILAETVTFRGPMGERDGRDACVEGLLGMQQLMSGLSLTAQGDLPTVNWSHAEDGLMTRIRATFDPRPLLEGDAS